MEKNLPVYQLEVADNANSGVMGISLVDRPAIQYSWIAFSEAKKPILLADNTQYLLTGPVMVPDQQIYRVDGNYEYFVTASKDVIKRIAQKFMGTNGGTKTTHMHQRLIPGQAFVAESWITRVDGQDKDLGFNLPAGTWMATVKVTDKDYWEKEIASKKLTGFSIEGYLDQIPVKKQPNKQNNMSVLTKMAAYFRKPDAAKADAKPEAKQIKLAMSILPVKNEAGEDVLLLTDGQMVLVAPATGGDPVEAPDGTYTHAEMGDLVVLDGKLAMPGETTQVEQAAAEMEKLTLSSGVSVELPVGLTEEEVTDASGAVVGRLKYERVAKAETDSSKSKEPVANLNEVATLAEQIKLMFAKQEAAQAEILAKQNKLAEEQAKQAKVVQNLELNQKTPGTVKTEPAKGGLATGDSTTMPALTMAEVEAAMAKYGPQTKAN